MGCAMELIKCVLFIFNLLFSLSGLALLAVGIVYKLNLEDYQQYLDNKFHVAPTLFIIVGAIVFCIAFFGCWGAIRENHCMIVTYAIFLLTIFIIEVLLGVYIYMQSDGNSIDETMRKEMNNVFVNYWRDPVARKSFDTLQTQLECCGLDRPADYTVTFANITVPPSCCKVNDGKPCLFAVGSYWTEGCLAKLDAIKDYVSEMIGIIAIAVAVVEIVGIIFALCLANSIKNANRRMAV